jgi:5,10-methylene-tetrahydrofolate dehydrogenase/methenyl tetrahydrofolate cyclohydrolase
LANGKQDKLVSGTNIKTINGTSILGSGDITIEAGSSNANVQAVDTGDVIDDVTVNYATKTYVDGLVGDINSVLESIING